MVGAILPNISESQNTIGLLWRGTSMGGAILHNISESQNTNIVVTGRFL